jgi:hypothetical protein
MRVVRIAPIVEGDGEMTAFPILLRRLVQAIDPNAGLQIARCFRHPSGSIRRAGGIERAVEAVAKLHRDHKIIVLIDSDDDCPKELGAALSSRVKIARPDLFTSIVLAHREYEAWFLSAAESLAGRRNLRKDLTPPADPEAIRNAKGWLSKNFMGTGVYSPTQDQASLSQAFDLKLAHTRSRSFRKLWKVVEEIVALTL